MLKHVMIIKTDNPSDTKLKENYTKLSTIRTVGQRADQLDLYLEINPEFDRLSIHKEAG
jgi:hypothetical protein